MDTFGVELNDPAFVAQFIIAKIRMMFPENNLTLSCAVSPGVVTVTFSGKDQVWRSHTHKMLTVYKNFEDRDEIVRRAVPLIMFSVV